MKIINKPIDQMTEDEWAGISEELKEHHYCEVVATCSKSQYPIPMWIDWCSGEGVNPDPPYLRVINAKDGPDIYNATKCCRLSMIEPEYVQCNDCRFEDWVLNDKEKTQLIEMLSSNIQSGDITIPVWDFFLRGIHMTSYFSDPAYNWLLNLKIPDYTQLPD